VLEQPEEIGIVQKDFNLEKEGSFILTIKNPEMENRAGMIESTVKYPKELQEKFKGRKWLDPEVTELLDYKGVVLLLVGESDDLKNTLGELGKEVEDLKKVDMKEHIKRDDQIWKDLRLSKKEFPIEPIFDGEWK